MMTRYLYHTALWILAAIAGILGGYFLARYTGIGDSIWGNEVDGYSGDESYRSKEAEYIWLPTQAGCIVGAVASALYSLFTFNAGIENIAIVSLTFALFNIWALCNHKSVADYNWSTLRNPANNLLRNKLCAEGTILTIEHKGYLTLITMDDGREYFFYYKSDGYKMKFGYRFWSDQIKTGEYYKASFVFNP